MESLNPIESIDRFHDSIPVPIVLSMKKIDDQYILIGANQNKITFLDSSFNFVKYIGREGKGPGEFLSPSALVAINNKIYVNDLGNRRINTFDMDGEFLNSTPKPITLDFFSSQFSLNAEEDFFFPTPFEEEGIKKTSGSGEVILTFAESSHDAKASRALYNDPLRNQIIGIRVSEAIIERFSYEGELLESYSFQDIPFVNNSISYLESLYTKSNQSWNRTSFIIVNFAEIRQDKLYLLVREHPENAHHPELFVASKMLIFDLEGNINLSRMLDLNPENQDRAFLSFTVDLSSNSLIAFDNQKGILERYSLN